MISRALFVLLTATGLAGPALATDQQPSVDPECQSQTTAEDLCAIAAQAAQDAQATLPHILDSGVTKGFVATAVVAEGSTILTTFTGPKTMDEMMQDLAARQTTLDSFQRQIETETIDGVCGTRQTADFADKGGYITNVFLTADGKAFAFVDIGPCDTSGN